MNKTQIAAYYFPNYHYDERNAKVHGPQWNEWELIKNCPQKFPGHYQPKLPMWGYEDESIPSVMNKKIKAAAAHGIDCFIFDWYYYNDGPFLAKGLDEGFLNAENNDRIKFALMWANHDWLDMHPTLTTKTPAKVLYPGKVTPETFDKVCDLVIEKYFKHPSYWKIDGKPYFSFYEISRLVENFGSIEEASEAIKRFRTKAKKAGLEGIHINAIIWDIPVLQNETKLTSPSDTIARMGFDSVSSYAWVHHVPLWKDVVSYKECFESYLKAWENHEQEYTVPYYPNLSMGWDNNPRYLEEFTKIMVTSPTEFGNTLETMLEKLSLRNDNRIMTINAWNEWTEGSYLEPDMKYGYGFLETIKQKTLDSSRMDKKI